MKASDMIFVLGFVFIGIPVVGLLTVAIEMFMGVL